MNTFFLIGFMGAGKSYWGKRWAQQLSFTFIELDALIEAKAGKTITQIFADEGEAYFRELESQVLKTYAANNSIVATGGGVPCFFDNMNWMNTNGMTVYLEASPPSLASRLVSEKSQRPLLNNIPNEQLEGFIAHKLKEREHFYQQAKLIIDASALTDDTLVPYIQ